MRFPLLATLVVGAAVAAMIALGLWQLGRAEEKEALTARFARNAALPTMALPPMAALDEALLYRRATAFCVSVAGWRATGGKAMNGRSGTRFIADCRTGAEGPGFAADMGVSLDPRFKPLWKGGEVTGTVIPEPPREGIFDRLTGNVAPPRPMIVAETPGFDLHPSVRPDPSGMANNSLSYAFQWFFFAAVAAIVYLLALRRRQRPKDGPPPAGIEGTDGAA
jgi:cytochrome oxidase assembly protein ShyY1